MSFNKYQFQSKVYMGSDEALRSGADGAGMQFIIISSLLNLNFIFLVFREPL